jgi:hypothetical protein
MLSSIITARPSLRRCAPVYSNRQLEVIYDATKRGLERRARDLRNGNIRSTGAI